MPIECIQYMFIPLVMENRHFSWRLGLFVLGPVQVHIEKTELALKALHFNIPDREKAKGFLFPPSSSKCRIFDACL